MKRKIGAVLSLGIILTLFTPVMAEEIIPSEPLTIIVTGSTLPWAEENTPTVVEVIEAESISTTANLGQVLDLVAGLDLHANRPTPGGISTVSIWGSTPTQVLILLDGIPLSTAWDGMEDLSYFPVEAIDRIEVQKGGSSSIYGNAAVGGVINIITKKGFHKENTVELVAGSFGQQEISLALAGPTGETSFYRLDVARKAGDGYLEHSAYQNQNLHATFTQDLTDYASASLTLITSDAKLELPPIPYAAADQTNQRLRIQGGYTYEDYHGLAWKGSLWVDTEERGYTDPFSDSEHEIETLGFNLTRSELGPKNEGLSLAVDGQYTSVDSTNVSGQPVIHTLGFFGEKAFVFKGWNLAASSRLDLHSHFGANLSPRLGLSKPAYGGIFKFSLGSSFKAPTANDLFWQDPWMVGDEDLKPERSWSAEASYARRNRGGLDWTLTSFQRYVDDMIRWAPIDPSNPFGMYQAQNIDHIRISGLELASTYQPLPTWRLTGAATVLQAAGSEEAIDPLTPWEYSLTVMYRPSDLWWASAKVRGTAARYNGVDGFLVTNLEASYTLCPQAKLTATISNLFDEEYQVNAGYPMPGRHIQAGISYSF